MDFNIQKFIKKIQVNNEDFLEKQELIIVLSEYVPNILMKNITVNKGIISFKNISPLKRSHIKRYKKDIIQKLHDKEIIVRDII